MWKKKPKRKRVVLALEKKLEVIKMLDKAVSYTIISEKFGIGHSTVGDIKKDKKTVHTLYNTIYTYTISLKVCFLLVKHDSLSL